MKRFHTLTGGRRAAALLLLAAPLALTACLETTKMADGSTLVRIGPGVGKNKAAPESASDTPAAKATTPAVKAATPAASTAPATRAAGLGPDLTAIFRPMENGCETSPQMGQLEAEMWRRRDVHAVADGKWSARVPTAIDRKRVPPPLRDVVADRVTLGQHPNDSPLSIDLPFQSGHYHGVPIYAFHSFAEPETDNVGIGLLLAVPPAQARQRLRAVRFRESGGDECGGPRSAGMVPWRVGGQTMTMLMCYMGC